MIIFNFIRSFGVLILLDILSVSKSSNRNLQCMDENNDPVDWFVLYKLPRMRPNTRDVKLTNSENTGKDYLYITSKDSVNWKKAKKSIDDANSMPGNTLRGLYQTGKSEEIWILYNDQPPEDASVKSTCGHTKGVVAANKNGGFWMVHSVPKFPDTAAKMKYMYPDTGTEYGQTFLCMSLKSDEMEKVGEQLKMNKAGVYYGYHSTSLDKMYPTLTSIAKQEEQKRNKGGPFEKKETLSTLGGNTFYSYAKNDKYSKDLYDDLVAPDLRTNLNVEAWRKGPGLLPSDCNPPYSVYNVNAVKLCTVKDECVKFTTTKDHSKWAVSENGNNNAAWVCIGDINRALSQERRGGGTVCFNNKNVWDAFFNSIADLDPCSKNNAKSKAKEEPAVIAV